MISGDKSDPQSGSESSASEDLSQHSTTIATSSTTSSPIVSAFASNARRLNANEAPPSIVSLTSPDGFGLSDGRNHNIAHFTTHQNSGFFPNGAGHLGHGGLHMMSAGYAGANTAALAPGSPEPKSVGLGATEATRKRAVRLQKNREAARECRRKKKEYIKCLENRVAVLENQNKALIEELRSLKELYSGTGKNFGNHDVQPKIEIL